MIVKFWNRLRAWWAGPLQFDPAPARDAKPKAARKRINPAAVARGRVAVDEAQPGPPIVPYAPPKGVLPVGLAMDWDCTPYDYVNSGGIGWGAGAFKGFPYLAMLMQQPEYRKISEIIAQEMTRKWIRLTSKGDDDKSERLEKLDEALRKYKVRQHFRKMAEYDGFFGRGQLFVHVKTPSGGEPRGPELETPLIRDPRKIVKGSLLGFKPVEPVWTYPGPYNSSKPLAPDYYKPSSWYVMGDKVHASRLLTFISREVPDLLKASYNFSGLSMSQLAEPYVNNWLRTRDSVGDIIHSFSTSGILTDMSSVLTEGDDGGELYTRMDLFNTMRDNRGLMALNKGEEEFFQFNTPLSTIDKLQAQAQEQQSAVASIPLVKLFGITPSGLNASSDGEIQVFYDGINAKQEADWREPLTAVIQIIQLSEFGDIDEGIDFEFLPLDNPDAVEAATVRKTDAETDSILINAGVIISDESRERLIHDPDNTYHSLESNPEAKDIAEELADREALAQAAAANPRPEPGGNDGPPAKGA
jgi:uncharacterized protein